MKSSRLATLRAVNLVVILSLAIALGISYSQPAKAATQIQIAILAPLTGDIATVGQEQLNFAKLAVENFKKASGLDVKLVQVDTEHDAAKAATGAQNAASNEAIVGVVGPAASQEAEAITPIFEKAGLVFISGSATRPSLTEKGSKVFFRVVPRDDVQGPTDANFIAKQLGAKSVYIVDDQSSYSTGLADEAEKAFKTLGVKTQRDSITQKDTDYSAIVTKIKAAAPDAIFIPFQVAAQGGQFAKEVQNQGLKVPLFGADSVFDPDPFIKNAAGATEGAYVSFFAPDLHAVPEAKDVVATYEKQYGNFGSFGGPEYAATIVLLEAAQRAASTGNLTRAAVLAEVAKTDQKSSILGIPIKFDAKGDIVGAQFYLFQVKSGKFELLTTSAPAAATAVATAAATVAATAAK